MAVCAMHRICTMHVVALSCIVIPIYLHIIPLEGRRSLARERRTPRILCEVLCNRSLPCALLSLCCSGHATCNALRIPSCFVARTCIDSTERRAVHTQPGILSRSHRPSNRAGPGGLHLPTWPVPARHSREHETSKWLQLPAPHGPAPFLHGKVVEPISFCK